MVIVLFTLSLLYACGSRNNSSSDKASDAPAAVFSVELIGVELQRKIDDQQFLVEVNGGPVSGSEITLK